MGRFLNADVIFDYDVGIIGYDLFTYCGNNPVRYIDICGTDCTDMLDGDFDEDDPYTFEGGGGHGGRNPVPPGSSGGSGGSGHSGVVNLDTNNSGNISTFEQATPHYTFRTEGSLIEHYNKHNPEMGYKYHSPQEYEYDANQVIQYGQYVPELNAYVRFYNYWGGSNYQFVGMTHDGAYITTFHIKSAHKIWE